MRILALCDQWYEEATRKVVGERARVVTCPPTFASDVEPGWLGGYDFIYVDLHGQPGSAYLYAGRKQELAALSVPVVRKANLKGTVVFAATCFLPHTPFLKAFLASGATAVMGGYGTNYGAAHRLVGAQHLAKFTIQGLMAGWDLETAFNAGLHRLRRNLMAWVLDPRETADTLEFRIWRAGDDE
jgi:hypothetical protein